MKFCKNLQRVVDISDPEWAPYWTNYKMLKVRKERTMVVGEWCSESEISFLSCFSNVSYVMSSGIYLGDWRYIDPHVCSIVNVK
jgi:hypothetical protein